MTASYPEAPASESAVPSVADIASALHCHMMNDASRQSPDFICAAVDRLAVAPSLTAADALALASFTDLMLKAALLHLPESEGGEGQNSRFFIAVARLMTGRTMTTLEAISGFAREGFDCEQRTTN